MSRRAENEGRRPHRATNGRTAGPVEVFYHDANTIYDAPIEALWEFILDGGEIHGGAHHATLRHFEGKELSPTCFEASYESFRGGRWRRCRSRTTLYPPLCKVGEHLEGDYAGTFLLFQYWPIGKRTRVDIWARLRSEVVSARDLRAHWRDTFAHAYEEDVAVLPKFLRQRRKA